MKPPAEDKLCEEKVRRYLNWLSAPQSLVDPDEVNRLHKEFEQTTDVIQRLRIAADLEHAENPSVDEVQQGFIECALGLSQSQGLPAAAFKRLGVPEADLKRAGILTSSDNTSKPRKRLTVAEVVDLVPEGPFSAKIFQDRSGASAMTVRRAIQHLLDEGRIESIGTSSDHAARGRAPSLFARR